MALQFKLCIIWYSYNGISIYYLFNNNIQLLSFSFFNIKHIKFVNDIAKKTSFIMEAWIKLEQTLGIGRIVGRTGKGKSRRCINQVEDVLERRKMKS